MEKIVILFALPGKLRNEDQILQTFQKNSLSFAVSRSLPELFSQIKNIERPVLIVADFASILDGTKDISCYDQFLHGYSLIQNERHHKAILIIVHPIVREHVENFVGYGNLVDGFIRQPLQPEMLLGLIERIPTK